MTDTPNLSLPIIDVLAQKHLIANDAFAMLDALVMLAVLDRDLTAPPGSPADGDRYLVKATGTGLFAGHDNQIAHFSNGDWSFYAPRLGWTCFVADESVVLTWDGSAWITLDNITELQNLIELGIGTTADATNPFAAKLNNALWVAKTVAEGGDGNLRVKLSKESAANTLSILFQDNFSGRAEIGLAGDDDFHFKVSPDGSTWIEAIKVASATGRVSFPASPQREILTANRTYYVRTDGSDSNDGLSNASGGAFLTIQKAIDTVANTIDLGGFNVTIQVADGTYTGTTNIYAAWVGKGTVSVVGNTTTPANCIISPSSGNAFSVGALILGSNCFTSAALILAGFKIVPAGSATAIVIAEGGRLLINGAMEYAGGSALHIQASRAAALVITADYTISGNATSHINAINNSIVTVTGRTITLTGSPVFSGGFMKSDRLATMVVNGNTFSGSTGASSKRYATTKGGLIDTGGGGASYFPGTTAGTDDGTGIYV